MQIPVEMVNKGVGCVKSNSKNVTGHDFTRFSFKNTSKFCIMQFTSIQMRIVLLTIEM